MKNPLKRQRAEEGDPGPAAASPGSEQQLPADGEPLPIESYDRLDDQEVIASLAQLSQVDLGVIEAHERSHRGRPAVLNKVRWLTASEPMPGYDGLDTEAIVEELAEADSETVRAVRDYELHHRGRVPVLDAANRVLPTATASAGEDRAHEERVERISEGYAAQKKTASETAQ